MPLDVVGSFVLVLALATVLVMVLFLRQSRSSKDVPIWLASAIVGILIGAAASAALLKGLGYDVILASNNIDFVPGMPATTSPPGASGGGPGGGPPAGGMMGMGGMGMGGMGGQPNPKRQLTTLVRKLELLTGDIAIALTDEQKAGMKTVLEDLAKKESLADDEAKATYDQILGMLTDDQKTRQDAVGLPFRRGGGGGGGGPAPPPEPNSNPFDDADARKALSSLATRVGGATP
ncbi:MAG: hypothetical protein FJ297_05305 [Planctomycetes bacterium]|nr:hypothetical protein [Planctomycetota bacterium]